MTAICALISPFAEPRNHVRRMCQRFIEVYVSTPRSMCEERDVKGLYAKNRRGELPGLTGLDAPYEPPSSPELVVDTSTMTPEHARAAVCAEWVRVSHHVPPLRRGDDASAGVMVSV